MTPPMTHGTNMHILKITLINIYLIHLEMEMLIGDIPFFTSRHIMSLSAQTSWQLAKVPIITRAHDKANNTAWAL